MRENSVQEESTAPPRILAPLLVSVRDVAEASLVADRNIELVDLKEPSTGPLAPCSPQVWHDCVRTIPIAGRWSIALGELEPLKGAAASDLAAEIPREVAYIKAGPAGIQDIVRLKSLWEALQGQLNSGTRLVAVAYADHTAAGCSRPENILRAAFEVGLGNFLVDTFSKTGSGTIACLGETRLRSILSLASELGIECVVAGRVERTQVGSILAMGARRVGIRGGLCVGARDGEICPRKLDLWLGDLITVGQVVRD
jgi:hypothetical protein